MAHKARGCVNSPDRFCFICREYTLKKRQRKISAFIKKVYFAYFGLKLGDQDKPWAPHNVCKTCEEDLRLWMKSKKQAFRFGIPMMWREQRDHSSDCYFCFCNVKGYNLKKKKVIPTFPQQLSLCLIATKYLCLTYQNLWILCLWTVLVGKYINQI